jgi:AcrR family transcriptional regulator
MAKASASTTTETADKPNGGLRRKLVEKEILDQATALFAERGFAGTTLKDLADALGMSRPALYYYFSSKDAVLERLVENLSGRDARTLRAIRRRRGPSAPEKLKAMATELATNAASNPQQSRILSQNRHQLPDGLAEAVREAERSIVRDLIGVVEDGIDTGDFRRVDAHTAAMSIVGMCIWTAWWVDPSMSESALEPVAIQIAEQAVAGLVAAEPRADRSSPESLLQLIREDLEQLERVIGSSG